jgi:small subunit ribosomal protein S1
VDALVTSMDKASRKVSLSIKAREISEEKDAVAQFGSSDSGASLGDILGAALKKKTPKKKGSTETDDEE